MNKQNTKQDNDLSMPKGYKKTKIGWIPENWKLGKVSSFISKLDSGISVNCVEESPITIDNRRLLKTSSITSGVLKLSESKVPALNERDDLRCSLKAGQILVCRKNTPELVGASVFVLESRDEYYIPDLIWQSQANGNNHLLFLYYLLQTDRTRFAISCRANGSSRSMVNISKGSFLGIQVVLPSLLEQQKIAQILSTWDKAIEQTLNLIEQLKKRKKGLMQKLLTGKTRLKGFSGEWKEEKLSKYFIQRSETKHIELPLLSVGINGVYPQNDSVKKDTSNSDKSKYKRICVGDIGYNTMRMWQGRSALSNLEGIVSPAYTIVIPKENANSLFFSYLFKLDYVVHRFYRNSQGLVSDTWQCRFKDFSIVKVDCPPTIEEQTAIAKVLTAADNEIKAQETYLVQLKDQKKGLMQQLLTGQKRVKID